MKCKHWNRPLTQNERYYINSSEHDYCVLCLVHEKAPMTQEEIGKYFGLSKMRVSQIQQRAMKKLQKRLHNIDI